MDMYSQPAGHAFIRWKVTFLSTEREFLHTSTEDFRNFPNGKAYFKSFSKKISVCRNFVFFTVV